MMLLLLACTAPDDTSVGDDSPADDSPADSDTQDSGLSSGDCTPWPSGDYDADAFPWQAWDNGDPTGSMRNYKRYEWTGGDGVVYNLYETPGWEAVRFEVADPSCIRALQVRWADLGPDGVPPTIGLYADFGENGIDFHPDQPYWVGATPREALVADTWLTYVVDPPLVVPASTLVYAASFRDGAEGPGLAFDGDTVDGGYCATWDACHTDLNYPDADKRSYYNGTSFPFGYDAAVRAQIDTLETFPAEDHWFQATSFSASANVSFGDYDDDGDDDVMTNGPTLYRNDGGTFVDVSGQAEIQAPGIYTSGGVWGDYDNDGCLDYFGLGGGYTGPDLLLHNDCDGTFSDATAASTITDWQDEKSCLGSGDPEWSPTAGATWTDFDDDGLIDLVQANFLCFDTYTYYPDRFWHNDGDGVFSAWSEEHGVMVDGYAGRGAATVDADLDGDLDVSIVDYVLQPNLYYDNQGGTGFDERGKESGLRGEGTHVLNAGTYYGHSIGLVWGDVDNDGDWDQVVGNLAHPRFYDFSDRTNLLIQDGGVWTNEAEARGIVYRETHSNPSLLDFDNDGDLDLTITEVYDGRPTDVYENDGTGHYTLRRWEAGITTENGWGTAVSDVDQDGDQDWLGYTLFANTHATGHWLELRLVGDVASNRAGIGAIAWVRAGDATWMRSVSGGNGTGGQDSAALHFGLGEATTIDEVTVWWPGGDTVSYGALAVDQGWRLSESGGAAAGLGR